MRVYIPSANRHGKLTSGPIRFVDVALHPRLTYVVPSGQGVSYETALDHLQARGVEVAVTPPEVSGIAETRLWIGRLASSRGESKFMMLDDDVKLQRRVNVCGVQLTNCSPDDVRDMLSDVESQLETHAHVGVSAREGNNRSGPGDRFHAVENTRTLRALAYRTEEFLACEHGRVPVMEDFDVNLQLLERGHKNCALQWWAQDQPMTNAPGGCSTYRTHALHEAAARRLAELHPGVVRLTQKQNKTDAAGFGSRTEVVISWKKAYQNGLDGREADASVEAAKLLPESVAEEDAAF